jgi:hypothetical protein
MRGVIVARLLLGAVLISCSFPQLSLSQVDPDGVLVATSTVNNPVLSVGDSILVFVNVKNVTAKPVSISNLFGWAPWYLKIGSKTGDKLTTYRLAVIDPDMSQAYKVRSLDPGAEFRLQYSATLERRTIRDISRLGYPTVEGLFLVFGLYAFEIPGRGEYELWFEERMSSGLADEFRSRVNVNNLWQGQVASNRVTLIVQ